MKDIEDYVVPKLATQWKELGKQLNIDQYSLNILQKDYPNDCKKCCSKMLGDWLEENTRQNATWEILHNAIDKLQKGTYDYLLV